MKELEATLVSLNNSMDSLRKVLYNKPSETYKLAYNQGINFAMSLLEQDIALVEFRIEQFNN